MTRRPPAPLPPGSEPSRAPEPPVEPEGDDPVGDFLWDDDPESLDSALLDPDAWPDDDDDPSSCEALLDAGSDLDALPNLDDDDLEEDEDLQPLETVPLEDDLMDLTAPDDLDLPVLPWSLDVDVDGVRTPAHLDPGAERSLLREPGAARSARDVVLAIAGNVVRLEVLVANGAPGIVLGRDVLAGRFLLRP